MKDLSRKVTLLCPLCGNDQFETADVEFDDLCDAPDDTKLKCADCGSEFTKAEILAENSEKLNIAVKEIEKDAVKEFEKEMKKAMKKWKI